MPADAETQPVAQALQALLGADGALVLAPHPDDETLGCGALLAASFASRRAVHVAMITDGDRSHPNSPTWPAARLARRRRQETQAALHRLGGRPADISFLGYPDCVVPHAGAALAHAAGRVRRIADRFGLRTILTTAAADPHCDHQAAARIAMAAARASPRLRVLFFPIWSRNNDADISGAGRFIVHHLPLGPFAATKRAALAAHESQLGRLITDDPDGFTLDSAFAELFLAEGEIFLEPRDADRDAA
jgi:LmbE family N-acetylglucosaminyl deacetylase